MTTTDVIMTRQEQKKLKPTARNPHTAWQQHKQISSRKSIQQLNGKCSVNPMQHTEAEHHHSRWAKSEPLSIWSVTMTVRPPLCPALSYEQQVVPPPEAAFHSMDFSTHLNRMRCQVVCSLTAATIETCSQNLQLLQGFLLQSLVGL